MVSVEKEPLVEVLYALPEEQTIVAIGYEDGMTAGRAVERSGLAERYPAIGQGGLVLGVWGVEVDADHTLRPGDRVEISRPLVADPRDMRRAFVTGGQVMGGASARGSVRKRGEE